MSAYVPRPVPTNAPAGLRAWLADELRIIALAFDRIQKVQLPALGAEPENAADGTIVYADGSNWNPGSGEGFYGREAGAWVKL